MPTIHDVAKKAGVAPITVSRVVNNSGYVSDAVRTRVKSVIDELGYVPNSVARSLRSKRTDTIALVFTDITNPFFNILTRGVEDAAFKAGFNVIICNTDESQQQENNYIQLLLQKRVDGILLVPAESNSNSIDLIRKHKTPLVILDRCIEDGGVDIVRGDSEGGAYILTKFLIDLGHKRITLLGGPEKVSTSIDRVKGYRRAMLENGLDEYIDYCYGNYSQESGAQITRKVFSRKEQPTAIFGGNNLISIGSMAALRELGYKVPDDVAVVSFDDIPENLTYNPFMTVIAQPPYEIGKKATQILVSRILNKEDTPSGFQEIVFPVELVVRESSGGRIN